ncbi:MAG: DUF1805 domain-containing protein [Elusimicrobia bacterium]|nr:DUF1805 domain-containing protein [Elusimicrobiota bacterium]
MKISSIKIGKKKALGIDIPMPNAKLILALGKKGYLMCGYLNLETAEKLGDCAGVIKGVKNLEDLLKGKVVQLTSKAKKMGIKAGMTGKKALSKLV